MHVVIRRYQVEPSSVGEVMRQIDEHFVPIIKDAPGFLAYYALDAGVGALATISVFEDLAGVDESSRMAAKFVRDNLASLLPLPPQIVAGEVGTHELNLSRVGVRQVIE